MTAGVGPYRGAQRLALLLIAQGRAAVESGRRRAPRDARRCPYTPIAFIYARVPCLSAVAFTRRVHSAVGPLPGAPRRSPAIVTPAAAAQNILSDF